MKLKVHCVYIRETETGRSQGFVSYFSSANENKQQLRASRGRAESAWRTTYLPRTVKHFKKDLDCALVYLSWSSSCYVIEKQPISNDGLYASIYSFKKL